MRPLVGPCVTGLHGGKLPAAQKAPPPPHKLCWGPVLPLRGKCCCSGCRAARGDFLHSNSPGSQGVQPTGAQIQILVRFSSLQPCPPQSSSSQAKYRPNNAKWLVPRTQLTKVLVACCCLLACEELFLNLKCPLTPSGWSATPTKLLFMAGLSLVTQRGWAQLCLPHQKVCPGQQAHVGVLPWLESIFYL